VGAFKAKTHLSDLLDRVSRGEKITITRHGVPAAMLVPVEEAKSKLSHEEIIEGMRKLRKRIKSSKMNVREMVTQGRRF
jgi:prevent-host-death family protein